MTDRELIERVYSDWGWGDYSKTDYLHPDFELVFGAGFLEQGTYKGNAAAWRAWRGWLDQWSTWRYTPISWTELDDGRFAIAIEISGISRTTGLELTDLSGNVWELEDGKVRRLTLYSHPDYMVEELGLSSP